MSSFAQPARSFVASVCLAPLPAWAAGPLGGAATNALTLESPLPDAGASALRVLGALVLVLALFGLGVWAVRHSSRLGLRLGAGARLRILEARSLSYRHSLYVVAYERERFLVGTSPGNITLLSPLPPGEPEAAAGATPTGGFATALRRILERKP